MSFPFLEVEQIPQCFKKIKLTLAVSKKKKNKPGKKCQIGF